ncbi:helix-turn-helix domain-containing protein [Paenibacillus lutrae]|uniref:Helix-turn-helix domain-containing protein n=1 Tax=Paenibacillus lutrae TaxID=2078573 RepID=A0A7X3JY87_9BACL|nr:helix-turn-helix domain-containing protein [Paenibacillus lutrae]MVO98704.1 helix-turn-helix domain-containing protein [Paenibacillus lutrae]
MRKREQTNKLYSNEVRKEAVRLHEEDKWTYKQITEKYGIQDKDRVRKWGYKFRKQGEYGLLDNRGRREEYINKDRYNQQLQRENKVLKSA